MGEVRWKPDQERAIEERNRDILVAAAAGSGKTAVMVERIIRMIREGAEAAASGEDISAEDSSRLSVDRMLVVTFTNAAAQEMREKIRRALKKAARAEENPGVRAALKRQLDLLPAADISTFHSFALKVIRRYFYLTDQEPDFQVGDEIRTEILKQEALDELIEDRYESKDPEEYAAFTSFLDRYSGARTDEAVREMLSDCYRRILALPDPIGTLEKMADRIEGVGRDAAKTEAFLASDVVKDLKRIIMRELDAAADCVREILGSRPDDGSAFVQRANDVMARILEAEDRLKLDGWEDFMDLLAGMKWPVFRGDDKVYKPFGDAGKDHLKKLREKIYPESLSAQLKDVGRAAEQAPEFVSLIRDLDRRFRQKKREQKLVDFNDIEHYCLDILRHPGGEARDHYRRRFRQIFIDEYQDTSIIQEAIVQEIASGRNRFMVGDIKQSIYKFRLAEPEIFMDKFRRYQNGDDPAGEAILLNQNFRSKKPILDQVNTIFRPLIPNYAEEAMLTPGADGPEDGPKRESPFRPGFIACLETGTDAEAALPVQRTSAQLEALEACRIIRENVGNPDIQFYDGKEERYRPFRYRDCVILMRNSTHFSDYHDIMEEQGIPLYFEEKDGYFDRMEIRVFLDILKVIDNKYQDPALIGALRSEVFGFTTDDLAEVRMRRPEGSYAEAVIACAEGDDPFALRCRRALTRIREWKEEASMMPLEDFIWGLMTESGYYLAQGALPNGDLRQANLRILAERAGAFAENAQASLYRFLQYVDRMRKHQISRGGAKLLGEDEDVVRIMTIHKSKGLEYPFVIIGGAGASLDRSRAGSDITLHKDVGLGMKLVDPEKHYEKDTLVRRMIRAKSAQENEDENIRILYVAMTRAQDCLYMIGTVTEKNAEKLLDLAESGMRSRKSYFEMAAASGTLPELIPEADLLREFYGDGSEEAEGAEEAANAEEEKGNPQIRAFVDRRLDFSYPYEEIREELRSKYSVSSLSKMAQDDPGRSEDTPVPAAMPKTEEKTLTEEDVRKPAFLQGRRALNAAERGTNFHTLMRHLDFPRALRGGVPYVEETLDQLVDREILSEEEKDSVDPRKAAAFFRTELGRRAAAAAEDGRLWRELSFNLRIRERGEDILVQGIIDAFFEEGDEIVLLDYKTNRIDKNLPYNIEENRIRDMYREQIRYYTEALEEGTGKPVKESWLYLADAGRAAPMRAARCEGKGNT